MSSKSELMQSMMLSRSEAEFFGSEPTIFHWADTMRPDGLIYGFTVRGCGCGCGSGWAGAVTVAPAV